MRRIARAKLRRRAPRPSKLNRKSSRWKTFRGFLGDASSFAKDLAGAAFFAAVSILFLGLLAAMALRVMKPRSILMVAAFEETPDVAKATGMSGKSAQDIFVDALNPFIEDAVTYYGAPGATGRSVSSLSMLPRIPVEKQTNITISGISLDQVTHVWNLVRYREWDVHGDILGDANGQHVRVTILHEMGSSTVDVPVQGPVGEAVRKAARSVMAEAHPELGARALIHEVDMAADAQQRLAYMNEADLVLHQWIRRNPTEAAAYGLLAQLLRTRSDDTGQQRAQLDGALLADWMLAYPSLEREAAADEKTEYAPAAADDGCKRRLGWFSAETLEPSDRLAGTRGNIAAEIGGREEILKALNDLRALAIRYPKDGRLPSMMGALLERQAEITTAREEQSKLRNMSVQCYLRAVERDNSNPNFHRDLGMGLHLANHNPEALRELKLSLHLAPAIAATANYLYITLQASDSSSLAEIHRTIDLINHPYSDLQVQTAVTAPKATAPKSTARGSQPKGKPAPKLPPSDKPPPPPPPPQDNRLLK